MAEWRTNFYYQQDLKSEEMNGIFNSSLIPGVYNADIRISETGGISLFNINIAAGTTLVFSNRTCSRDKKYYRQFADFSNLAKYNYYTIKSTAETDLVATVPPVGRRTLPDRFYLVAVMPYGDPRNDSPIFKLAEPTDKVGDPLIKEINATDDSYIFYDGLPDGDFGDAVAYLIIGEFIRTGNPVATDTDGTLPFGQFASNYVFTRRGLEEYRYSFSTDKNIPIPDFSYTKKLDAIKIYWSTFTANSILFKSADTRDYYDEFIKSSEVASLSLSTDPTDPPVSGSGVIYDFIFAAFQDTYQDNYELKNLMTDTSYPSVPTLYSCKWIQDVADDFDTITDLNLAEGITSQFNLLGRVAGRPILSRVATAIKRGEAPVYSATGDSASISPENLSTIIPIALVMRPFKDGVGVNKCAVGSKPKLNPELVVSYFDIYQGANECSSIGLSKEDIYSTVAILD